jgi:hypothetical protein
MSLVWQQPLEIRAASADPESFVYWISFPGLDLSAPKFHAVKGLPTDASGAEFKPDTEALIGDYDTLEAAKSACQTDYQPVPTANPNAI